MELITAASLYSQLDLPRFPLWVIVVVLLILLPASIVGGYWRGTRHRKALVSSGKDVSHVVGETALSALLALLGLLLAFSFGNSLSVFQARKAATVDEAAALGTVFLRADYLPDDGRIPLQEAILEYAKTRVLDNVAPLSTQDAAQAFLETTLAAQAKLWPLTLEATADPVEPPIKAFVASAMNEALDAHLYRLQVLSNPISEIIHVMVLGAACMGLFLFGNRAGLLGRTLTWRIFAFSGFLLIVMYTIVDTQRAKDGFIRVDDLPLLATIFDMEQALADRS